MFDSQPLTIEESRKPLQAATPNPRTPAPDIRRLVVVIPDGLRDEAALAREVWALVGSTPITILYLGFAASRNRAAALRRMLASLARATSFNHVTTETRVFLGPDWLRAIQQIWTPGDLVICLPNHREVRGLFRTAPVAQQLTRRLNGRVHSLNPLEWDSRPWRRVAARELAAWVMAGGLIVLFSWFQIRVPALSSEPLTRVVLVASVVVELLALWQLNAAFTPMK